MDTLKKILMEIGFYIFCTVILAITIVPITIGIVVGSIMKWTAERR